MARKRIDPVSRPADGYRPYEKLKNTRPDKDYRLVNPNDEMTGVAAYQDAGWTVETIGPDGVRVSTGRTAKDGDAVTSLGQYVMSRPKEFGQQEFEAGQAVADALDNRILANASFEGPARTRDGKVAVTIDRSINGLSAPFEEVEEEGA